MSEVRYGHMATGHEPTNTGSANAAQVNGRQLDIEEAIRIAKAEETARCGLEFIRYTSGR